MDEFVRASVATRADVSEVRVEIANLRGEIRTATSDLRGELYRALALQGLAIVGATVALVRYLG